MECINWKEHPSDIICLLATVYQNDELIDCELDTEGGLLKGHRVVLGACSPYLKKVLMEHQEKKTILLKQVKYKDMKLILDFIYYGGATLPATDVASLMATCQFLQILSLRSCLVSHVSGKSESERSVNESSNTRDVDLIYNDGETRQTCPRKLYLKKRERLGSHSKNVTTPRICVSAVREAGGSFQSPDDLNNSEAEKTFMDSDNENLGGEVGNRALAAIPLVAVKMEGLDDQDDADNLNEEGSNLLEKGDFGIKTEGDSEVDICENRVPLKTKVLGTETDSSHELNVKGGGDDVAMVTEQNLPFDETTNSDNSGRSAVEQPEVFATKCGSMCEVPELDVGGEKPLVSCVNSKNIEEHDVASSSLKQRRAEVTRTRSDKEHRLCVGSVSCAKELQETTVPSERPPLCGRKPCREMETAKNDNSDFDNEKASVRNTSDCNGDPEDALCFTSSKVKREHELSSHGDSDVSLSQLCPLSNASECEAPDTGARHVCDTHEASTKKRNVVRKCERKLAEEKSYDCDICGKSFKIKSRLMPHMRTHTGEKPFDCGICGKSFDAKSRLKPHMRIHTGEKPYVCEFCGKSFNQNGGLKVHMRTHTGEKPFPCSDCDAAFIQKYLLEKHINKFHLKERPYLCNVCGKSFFTSCSLKRHMITHTEGYPHTKGCPDPKEYQFLCHVCEKPFVHKSQLNAHMVIHTGERPYQCGVCHKTFRQRCSLYAHKKIHTGEKNHHCTFCPKSFIHKEDLKRHVRIHTGENPYPCSVCLKAFKAKNKLKAHMRTHSGEKPFLCSICGKGLKAKWNLRLHMRTHSGENN